MVRLEREMVNDNEDAPVTSVATGVEQTPGDTISVVHETPGAEVAVAEQQSLSSTAEAQKSPETDQKIAEKEAEIKRRVEIQHRVRTNKRIGLHNRDARDEGGIGPTPPDGESKHLGEGLARSLRALEFNPGLQNEITTLANQEAARLNYAVDPAVIAERIKSDAARVIVPLTYPPFPLRKPVLLWDKETDAPPKTRHFQHKMTPNEILFATGSPLLRAGWEGRHLGLYAARPVPSGSEIAAMTPEEASAFFRRRELDAAARTDLFQSVSPAEQVAFLCAEMAQAGMLSPLRRDSEQALALVDHTPIDGYLDQVDRFIKHEIPWGDPDAWKGGSASGFDGAAVNLSLRSLRELGDGLVKEADIIVKGLDTWIRKGQITHVQAEALEHQAMLAKREGKILGEEFGKKDDKNGMDPHKFAHSVNAYVKHNINPHLRNAHRREIPDIPILSQTNDQIARQCLAIAHGGIRPSLPHAPHGFRQQGPGTDQLQQTHYYANRAMDIAQDLIDRPKTFADFQDQQRQRGSTEPLRQQQWRRLQESRQERVHNERTQQLAIKAEQQEQARQAELQRRAVTLELTQGPERGYGD